MWRATEASGANRRGVALRALLATLALGAVFLAVQGFEWTQLMRYGLSASRSTYGGMFYTLIGCHAVHALGAVTALLIVSARYARGTARHAALEVTQLYWLFVVAVWPVLYVLVYLL